MLRTYHSAFTGLPRGVWLLSAAALVNRAGTMVLPFLALFLTEERGLSVSQAGRLIGVYGVGSLVGSYVGGWLSDRIGATRTQLISLIGSGVGYVVFVRLQGFLAMAVGVLVLSALADAFRPGVMADMAHRAPEEVRARAYALLRLAVNLGMALGPALAGFLAVYDYAWLFYGDAATSWLAAILLVVLLKPSRPRTDGATGPAAEAATAGGARSPWRDVPFVLLSVWVVAYASVLFQAFTTLPIYFHEVYGFREDGIGAILAWNAALIVLFEMLLMKWAESRNPLPLVAAGGLLTCLGMGLMPLGRSVGLALLSVAVWTIGEMLALPLLNVVVAARARPENRGRYMGIYMVAFAVAFIVAPLAGTWVFENVGRDALWYGAALLGPLLAVGALALRRLLPPRPTVDDAP